MVDAGRFFLLAWKFLPRLPSPLVYGGFDLAGRLAHRLRGGGVKQLERNLHRVTGLEGRALRSLCRENLRRYMRYYAEVFQLPRIPRDKLAARVRTVNLAPTQEALRHSSVVVGLGHAGNWDLAGAWSESHFAHVITVAEKLEPQELFAQFLRFRENLGMEIFAFEKGKGLFRELVAAAGSTRALMPLLADRDLTKEGVVVDVCDHPMRVAPGPATVSLAAGVPLVGAFIRHERLRGSRRRVAGSRWGIVIEFTNPIEAPQGREGEKATAMMQSWADHFSRSLRTYPQDWHMLQKCFVADLDAQRLERADTGIFSEDR